MTAHLLVEADPDEVTFVNNYEETVLKAKMASARVERLVEQIEAARKAAKNARGEVRSLVEQIAAAKKEEKNARGEVRKDRQKFKNLMKTLVKKHPRDPSHILNFLTTFKPKKVGVSVQ